MAKVVDYERELNHAIDRLDARLLKLRQFGLKLWTGVFRRIVKDMESARIEHAKRQQAEVMLLESEVRAMEKHLPAAALEGVLQRIGKLKGLLVLSFLALSVWQAVGFAGVARRRGGVDRGVQVRSVMKVRSRRRDEEVLWG